MSNVWVRLAVVAVLLLPSLARAHHSYVGVYDPGRLVSLKGVVTEVRFANPHVFFSLEVPGKGTWRIETESVAKITTKGLSQNLLKEGAAVTVQGWTARDGSAALGLRAITLPGGKTITIRNTAR